MAKKGGRTVGGLSRPTAAQVEKRVKAALIKVRASRADVDAALVELCGELVTLFFEGDLKSAWRGKGAMVNGYFALLTALKEKDHGFTAYELSVSLRVFALDGLLSADRHWPALSPTQKEALLPLRELDDVRDGAKHANTMNLKSTDLRQWVADRLAGKGIAKQRRVRRVQALATRLQSVELSIDERALDEYADQVAAMPPEARDEVVGRIDATLEKLKRLKDRLKKRR